MGCYVASFPIQYTSSTTVKDTSFASASYEHESMNPNPIKVQTIILSRANSLRHPGTLAWTFADGGMHIQRVPNILRIQDGYWNRRYVDKHYFI